jgi:hypothetical protein
VLFKSVISLITPIITHPISFFGLFLKSNKDSKSKSRFLEKGDKLTAVQPQDFTLEKFATPA